MKRFLLLLLIAGPVWAAGRKEPDEDIEFVYPELSTSTKYEIEIPTHDVIQINRRNASLMMENIHIIGDTSTYSARLIDTDNVKKRKLPHLHAKIIYLDDQGNPVGWGEDVRPLLPDCEQGCGTLTIIPEKPGPPRIDTSTNIPVYFDREGR